MTKAKILILDDEPSIRTLSKIMLERHGFEVGGAESAAEMFFQLAEAEAMGEPYHTVILDLSMPDGLGGIEVLPQLREMHPKLKTIVSSGYMTSPEMLNPLEHGFDGAVSKPFHMDKLVQTISSVCE